MSALASLVRSRVNAKPVGYVRAFIGAAALLRGGEAWDILNRSLASTSIQLPYISWVPVLPYSAIPWLCSAWLLAAIAFMISWKTRIAGAILTAIMFYVLLIDQQTYSHHLYLMTLVIFLLTIADSGAAFSIESRKSQPNSIVAWPVLLISIQLTLVYLFGAITKLNSSYLNGDVLENTLRPDVLKVLSQWRGTTGLISLLSWLAVASELLLTILLWYPSRRTLLYTLGLATHFGMTTMLTATVALQLQVFSIVCVAIFFLPRTATTSSN